MSERLFPGTKYIDADALNVTTTPVAAPAPMVNVLTMLGAWTKVLLIVQDLRLSSIPLNFVITPDRMVAACTWARMRSPPTKLAAMQMPLAPRVNMFVLPMDSLAGDNAAQCGPQAGAA